MILKKKNKSSNHKIFISKFDSLYSRFDEFTNEFVKEYNDNHITPLNDDELGRVALIYKLMAKCCNGITTLLENKPEENLNINERTTPTELFNIYLNQLNFNETRFDFKMEATQFMLEASMLAAHCKLRGISFNQMMNNYDMYYFFEKMQSVVNKDDFIITGGQIQKDLKDLREIYDILHTPVKTKEETLELFKEASTLIFNLISKKRIKNYFIRIS